MGMSQVVECPGGVPAWPVVAAALKAKGHAIQMRMIDGQLAFPDEQPSAEWRELRISLGGAMVTVRRQASAVEVVTWGNADDAQRAAWEAVTRGFAAGSGSNEVD